MRRITREYQALNRRLSSVTEQEPGIPEWPKNGETGKHAGRFHINYTFTEGMLESIGRLLRYKGQNYGPSFKVVAEVMRLYFPEGIPPEAFGDALLMVRVFDKFARIAYGDRQGDDTWADLVDPETPWKDIIGYAALAVESHQNTKSRGLDERNRKHEASESTDVPPGSGAEAPHQRGTGLDEVPGALPRS